MKACVMSDAHLISELLEAIDAKRVYLRAEVLARLGERQELFRAYRTVLAWARDRRDGDEIVPDVDAGDGPNESAQCSEKEQDNG